MTIDEYILDCIHYTSTDLCKYEGIHWSKPQIEQIAEWLEELKSYKEKHEGWMWDEAEMKGYNKAIDDFVNVCEKQFITMYGQRYVDMRDIVNIAEQLKEGGKNDKEITISERNKAIDDAKSVILQTLDNEILVDTLHLRLEQLKAGASNGTDNQ